MNIYNREDNIFNKDDKYVVPLYQRAYAWSDDEINQLIEDVNGYDGNNYYIGSLIVHQREDKSFEVIDGQQRLTTLFLLFLFLEINVKENLSFDCRRKSNLTLQNLVKKYVDKTDEKEINDNDTEESLISGIKIIEEKFIKDDIDKEVFKERLSKVILYRIEVPKYTDLNRYFEIMNTRGEQLEQADILKALFMERINNVYHNEFAKIWDACADMTGYVQMNMSKELRKNIFGDDWKEKPKVKEFLEHLVSDQSNKKNETDAIVTNAPNNDKETIDEILAHNYNDYSPERIDEEGERVRFDSAISFTYFLLHVLRIFKCIENSNQATNTGLLDDMQLLKEYRELLRDKEKDKNLPLRFIDCLLKCRFLFDKYIIKREYREDNPEGKWSIKQLNKSEKDTAYYTETFSSQKSNCLMLQAAMRVSFTSPKVMHWITESLWWLFKNEFNEKDFEVCLENIAKNSVKKNLFEYESKDSGVTYKNLGVQTRHIAFNYLDYLLWKEDNEKYANFIFEYRNSVEHWYPQNPSGGTFEQWTKHEVDHFGNLCIIQRNVNSKFSNLEPHSKKATFEEMINKGSIKLRLMAEKTKEGVAWKNEYEKFGEDMLNKLAKACGFDRNAQDK